MGCPAGAGSGWVGGGGGPRGHRIPPPPPPPSTHTARIYTLGNYRFHSGLEDQEAKKWQFLFGGGVRESQNLGASSAPFKRSTTKDSQKLLSN